MKKLTGNNCEFDCTSGMFVLKLSACAMPNLPSMRLLEQREVIISMYCVILYYTMFVIIRCFDYDFLMYKNVFFFLYFCFRTAFSTHVFQIEDMQLKQLLRRHGANKSIIYLLYQINRLTSFKEIQAQNILLRKDLCC